MPSKYLRNVTAPSCVFGCSQIWSLSISKKQRTAVQHRSGETSACCFLSIRTPFLSRFQLHCFHCARPADAEPRGGCEEPRRHLGNPGARKRSPEGPLWGSPAGNHGAAGTRRARPRLGSSPRRAAPLSSARSGTEPGGGAGRSAVGPLVRCAGRGGAERPHWGDPCGVPPPAQRPGRGAARPWAAARCSARHLLRDTAALCCCPSGFLTPFFSLSQAPLCSSVDSTKDSDQWVMEIFQMSVSQSVPILIEWQYRVRRNIYSRPCAAARFLSQLLPGSGPWLGCPCCTHGAAQRSSS